MWVPSSSHEKNLERTGLLLNLEFLIVGERASGSASSADRQILDVFVIVKVLFRILQ